MWNDAEIELLKKIFDHTRNDDLLSIFDKSKCQISLMAQKLKLKKSKEHKSAMIAKRNKMQTRDLTFEFVEQIASKFKTRAEFQHKDHSAYCAARRAKWLDSICGHMISQSYSIPQLILRQIVQEIFNKDLLYNDRKTIKPLELDVYVPELKIAFEYNGNHWHRIENKKYQKCQDLSIKLFTVTETSRKYEQDVKTQLIKKLDEINIHCNTNISANNINSIIIDYDQFLFNEKEIIDICSRYTDFKKFRTENINLYYKLFKLHSVDKFTSHMNRSRQKWTETKIVNLISEYKYLGDFYKENFGAYLYCKRYKPELLDSLINARKSTKIPCDLS